MTRAPSNLLAVRRLLLDHLDDAPGTDDLQPAEVGIVGDTAHQDQGDSYHLGKPHQRSSGYSISESPRDRALTDLACALDVGEFKVTVDGRAYDLAHFSAWCVGQCKAGAADTRDIREIIWSPDGRTVKRWDRLGRRSTGDSSHRWHTHFSFFRDSIKAGRDQTPLFRRYLRSIGLIVDPPQPAPTPVKEPDMEQSELLTRKTAYDKRTVGHVLADLSNLRDWLVSPVGTNAFTTPQPGSPLALLLGLAARSGDADEAAIVAGILAGLTPEKVAAAIPPAIARQVVDELAARLTD
ncbi:hypothetical protein [Micromonospora sp. NPDC023633]|uniref:hypothetical protein n=1 Tax=Micromonospora sp. NPDC023633 TaxID=3154320 RepID=UPI0033FBB133